MDISIVGVAQTSFGELWDQSLEDLIQEVIQESLVDSQLNPKDIQSVYVGNMLAAYSTSQQHLSALIAEQLGHPVPVVRVEAACASGGMAIRSAVDAIRSQSFDNALVIGVEKMTDLDSNVVSQALMSAAGADEMAADLTFPGLYALMAKAYMNAFAAKERDLANVAVKNHYHAQFNDKAHFRFTITPDQVLTSPKVSDPLKVLDCSPISDGAAAIVLANPKWVKKRSLKNGAYISGSAHMSDSISLAGRESLTEIRATQLASQKAYQEAGLLPSDVDCVEIHDCFTIAEMMALEDLGFYNHGESYHYIEQQETRLGGKLPVNTSGGLKACGHPVGATGVKQLVEATLQLRGKAQKRQVADAKVCVTHNVGGTGGTAVVHVLKK